MSINKSRGFLYKLARFLGDFQAVRKGPKAMAKRAGRRVVGKATGKGIGKLFK
ncbi:hypothetical protein [Anaerobacillus alkaliphilus]|uniref:hypothetical protein n=1 Tax=Anaerobacillus alkaliphilus TaxID=1548597 RepID=UPI0018A8A029|nr:hypothetical protein [Anaerobacillus alkaliphilus]